MFTAVNVALGKSVFQSSTAWGGLAERAVDGNTNPDFYAGNSCMHTTSNILPLPFTFLVDVWSGILTFVSRWRGGVFVLWFWGCFFCFLGFFCQSFKIKKAQLPHGVLLEKGYMSLFSPQL